MALRIHGRRRLKSPPGSATRPTSGRVRQAVFGMLQDRIEGCRWLDLCSGAGTMGAEALSRGASLVLGVELSAKTCSIIQQNWATVAQAGQSFRVISGNICDVLRRMPENCVYDIVYFDPPYSSDIYESTMKLLPRFVSKSGIVIVEHRRGRIMPEIIGTLQLSSRRHYGQTELSIYNQIAREG
jgi:16S rRNA (guanine966-N2)-methyltransferase